MSLNMRFKPNSLRRMGAILLLAGLLAVAAAQSLGGSTSAGMLDHSGAQAKAAVYDDGFDNVPQGLQGLSYSTLAHMGRVHRPSLSMAGAGQGGQGASWRNPFSPLLTI